MNGQIDVIANHVVHIGIDGLRPDRIELAPGGSPNLLKRFRSEVPIFICEIQWSWKHFASDKHVQFQQKGFYIGNFVDVDTNEYLAGFYH